MINRPIPCAALLVSVFFCASAFALTDDDDSSDDNDRQTACEGTARTMLRACRFDTRDDFYTTLANCKNINDAATRRACKAAASASRLEDAESCEEVSEAREDACELLGEDRYDPDPLLDPGNAFIDPDAVPDTYPVNPYVSIASGHTYVLSAGQFGEETVVVHVTEDVREVQGVSCRVVADMVVEASEEGGIVEYETIEATDDLFAQDEVGNIFYCGEVSRNFEDGVLRDLEGSFESGREFAKSGILIRAFPVAGDTDRQEFLLGDAEDIIEYVDLATGPTDEEGGDNPGFPCGTDGCLKTFEHAPLEPIASEFKYYRAGLGFVLGVSREDGEFSGERDQLLCIGDSLDILQDPACGIADPEELLDELCKRSPDAFCVD